uniref:Uncharacterized protein n=1 Tax=Arundo donax TaxID=35708 RepID=A0A0A9GJD4_ARUDO
MPDRAELRQEVLLLLLVRRRRRRQPLHRDGAAVVQDPTVHLAVPALAHHVVLVEAIGGPVELVVGEAPPGGLVRRRRRRRLDVDALLGGLISVAPAAEGQEPLQAPAPEVVHLPPRRQESKNAAAMAR